jgi:FtsP/CotA-like multicopper oxidase with cupredoxin domain
MHFNFISIPTETDMALHDRNGMQHRKNSWMDGMPGTQCPILPNTNFTYKWQPKDQIGSFFYFPSVGMQRAAGGYGGISVYSRLLIPVPFDQPPPENDHVVLIGDWYTQGRIQDEATGGAK